MRVWKIPCFALSNKNLFSYKTCICDKAIAIKSYVLSVENDLLYIVNVLYCYYHSHYNNNYSYSATTNNSNSEVHFQKIMRHDLSEMNFYTPNIIFLDGSLIPASSKNSDYDNKILHEISE